MIEKVRSIGMDTFSLYVLGDWDSWRLIERRPTAGKGGRRLNIR